MLATEIQEFRTGLVYPDGYEHDRSMDGLRRRLGGATKFVLDPQACAMAANVALSKPSSVIAALAFARLPADPMWIEFSNVDVRRAMEELGSPNITPPRTAVAIERSGFLLSSTPLGLVLEYVHADRTPDGRRLTDLCPVSGIFSLSGIGNMPPPPFPDFVKEEAPRIAKGRVQHHLDVVHRDPAEAAAEKEIRSRFRTMSHPDLAAIRRNLVAMSGEEEVLAIEEAQGREMYRLFALQVLPALILLNCRNAVDAEVVPAPEKLNRQRARKGKAPLPEYRIVRVHLSPSRRRAYESTGRTAAAARGHLVTGHFKVRKSGVYWWSPHWRGSTKDAVPDKTYVVTR